MKKKFLLLVILPAVFFACTKNDNPLGPNANISQVGVSIGLSGDTLTITGTGFTNSAQLSGTFNGVPITVLDATSTQLVASIPFTYATSGIVSILNGTSATPITFDYSLSISNIVVSPDATGNGTMLTITGSGFIPGLNGLQVTYGGQTFTVTSSTATQILASNVAYAPITLVGGLVGIGITGQHIGTRFYMAITGVSPTAGNGGTSVTITGLGFSSDLTQDIVKFNGSTATVTSATSTQLNVVAPVDGNSGPVSVTVGNNTVVGASFNYPMDVSTFAGSGKGGSADGVGTAASFSSPENGAFDSQGNMYIADYGNNEIRLITPNGTVSTFAGSTKSGFADGNGTKASFNAPSGLVFDKQGNLYVSDELNNAIRKIDPQGNVTTIAGTGNAGYRDAPGTSASFNRPIGLGIDNISGLLYVADSRNNVIRSVDLLHHNDVFTVAGSGLAGSTDGTITGGGDAGLVSFNSPRGIAVSSAGSPGSESLFILIADYGNNKIREIITNPNNATAVITLAGSTTNSPGFSNNPNAVTFNGPNSVCLGFGKGGETEFFIADASNHAIRYSQSDPTTIIANELPVLTLAGTGSQGLMNGTYTAATFNFPDGVAFNPKDGNLYVIEFGNSDIRKIILP